MEKWNWEYIPEIKTDRLLLDGIKEKDIEVYNEIIFDKSRNKYWGYDDMLSIEGAPLYDSFYRVAKEDFFAHEAINFAVRLKGEMIGEAVLFDFRNEESGKALISVCELGCRILPDMSGMAYGAEAFYGALNWALDSGLVSKVVAKCFHENTSSFKMLSRDMDYTCEDETFKYFSKSKSQDM